MPFNVTPKAAPTTAKEYNQQEAKDKASARQRAIEAVLGKAPEAPQGTQEALSAQASSGIQAEAAQVVSQNSTSVETPVETVSSAEVAPEAPKAAAEAPQASQEKQAPSLSSQYAQLARREKMLRAREAELKRQMEASKPVQEAPKQEFDKSSYISREDLKKNPFKTLQELGITYDQVTQEALNAPSAETIQLMNRIAELEAKISKQAEAVESTKKTWEQQQEESYKQALNQLKHQVTKLVTGNDDFEMINVTGSTSDVVELIERTFKEEGYVMDVTEAAKEIEEYLAEEALKLAKAKKVYGKLNPPSPEKKVESPSQKSTVQDTQKQPATKTLTNAMSTTRKLTARERAILAAKGEKVPA